MENSISHSKHFLFTGEVGVMERKLYFYWKGLKNVILLAVVEKVSYLLVFARIAPPFFSSSLGILKSRQKCYSIEIFVASPPPPSPSSLFCYLNKFMFVNVIEGCTCIAICQFRKQRKLRKLFACGLVGTLTRSVTNGNDMGRG
eukprot:TRINITY_DN1997_c1_g1_i1.p1 TRINITY_DN1997_c1_g1~~TRINITY_DN1997_c1_g1_i1.p1  ORF type:complete len:144 (-),score=12.45 TRINITY_DN1997_c1_g1_i1:231-662(-)